MNLGVRPHGLVHRPQLCEQFPLAAGPSKGFCPFRLSAEETFYIVIEGIESRLEGLVCRRVLPPTQPQPQPWGLDVLGKSM